MVAILMLKGGRVRPIDSGFKSTPIAKAFIKRNYKRGRFLIKSKRMKRPIFLTLK